MYKLMIDGYTIEFLTYAVALARFGGVAGLKRIESAGFRLVPVKN